MDPLNHLASQSVSSNHSLSEHHDVATAAQDPLPLLHEVVSDQQGSEELSGEDFDLDSLVQGFLDAEAENLEAKAEIAEASQEEALAGLSKGDAINLAVEQEAVAASHESKAQELVDVAAEEMHQATVDLHQAATETKQAVVEEHQAEKKTDSLFVLGHKQIKNSAHIDLFLKDVHVFVGNNFVSAKSLDKTTIHEHHSQGNVAVINLDKKTIKVSKELADKLGDTFTFKDARGNTHVLKVEVFTHEEHAQLRKGLAAVKQVQVQLATQNEKGVQVDASEMKTVRALTFHANRDVSELRRSKADPLHIFKAATDRPDKLGKSMLRFNAVLKNTSRAERLKAERKAHDRQQLIEKKDEKYWDTLFDVLMSDRKQEDQRYADLLSSLKNELLPVFHWHLTESRETAIERIADEHRGFADLEGLAHFLESYPPPPNGQKDDKYEMSMVMAQRVRAANQALQSES